MKVILFLAAIYTLIIHQCYQKKTTILPLPAPTHKAQPIALDTTKQAFTSIIMASYKEKPVKQNGSSATSFILSPTW
jgi:hypothetical protein